MQQALVALVSSLPIALLVASLFGAATDASSLPCTALSFALKEKVSFPASAAYVESSNPYWSLQESSLVPACIVTPAHTNDVVIIIRTLTLLIDFGFPKINFAIRGGGHTPWAGSANINGGVTIDMRSIDDVTVNQNETITSVGAGALWGDVYRKHDSLGLAVVGGRGSVIGVGGLLTGGNERD
jgi:hypothetical protein